MAEDRQGGVSVAVLPFEDLSAEGADSAYFARGFVEDVVTDLSRFPELLVIAPHSAQRLLSGTGEAGTVEAGAAGVDYLLSGSIRRDEDTLRITTRLLRPSDGRVEWAGRFERPLSGVFELQDEISAQVVATLQNRINASLLAAARRKPPTELAAYDLWLRGFHHLKQGTLEADQQARELFERALQRDPRYARAYVGLSLSYFNEWSCQLWNLWHESEQRAYTYALRASELDDEDHVARVVLGRVLLFRREFDLAEPHFDRALSLNENDADCLVQIAMGYGFLGRCDEALALYERAVRLNPYHEGWYHAYGVLMAFVAADYPRLIKHGTSIPMGMMVDLPAYLAVSYQALGDHERARQHVQIFIRQVREKITGGRELEPGEALRWAQHVSPYRRPQDELRLIEGLRAAGMERDSSVPAPIVTPERAQTFRKVGSLWQVRFAGRDAHVPDLKGCSDIAALLSRPGEAIHSVELMGGGLTEGGADDVLDAQAKSDYRKRISELREELEEAQCANDLGRAEILREELHALTEHLEQALALGGRSRKLGAPSERARAAVTWRLRSALKKIEQVHEPLGKHLQAAIHTGTFCSYDPPTGSLSWEL